MTGAFDDQWNHDSHYYESVADLLDSPRFNTVVDVGCGEGTLARYLARRHDNREVIGVDPDPGVLPPDTDRVHCLLGTAENLPVASGTTQALTAVASLHHTDERAALAEMRRVIAPGGRIIIIGLARSSPADPYRVRDLAAHWWYSRRTTAWQPPTEVCDPELTWAATRRLLDEFLPGNRWTRLPMWRYRCVWDA